MATVGVKGLKMQDVDWSRKIAWTRYASLTHGSVQSSAELPCGSEGDDLGLG